MSQIWDDDVLQEIETDYIKEELELHDEFLRLGDDEEPRWGSL